MYDVARKKIQRNRGVLKALSLTHTHNKKLVILRVPHEGTPVVYELVACMIKIDGANRLSRTNVMNYVSSGGIFQPYMNHTKKHYIKIAEC